ncbi:uncharacterized protein AMSG_00732 [Thecamonas trahens ATCC 50062]|uniref:Uncharacterized protein n=1 Tax=Thecamonas trahens ATCC 50062 TaxID=461836 RepID=A0A0L0DEL5_THETB|nr:hypothetical protein AMSG_00732 [Thecamonas trahens ATCC 50062]KNC50571.1 hypothetical protein AMSG_00732 [Thecamonas trahens ATCC 50062]|eukprot:XP_013762461.1 hypothetical protein AMSG_00732 [Thecamonas trahens ATCC 50062]
MASPPSYDGFEAASRPAVPPDYDTALLSPPDYDDIAYDHCYATGVDGLATSNRRLLNLGIDDAEGMRRVDQEAMHALRWRAGAFAAFLLVCNMAVIVASLAAGRSFGVFFAGNLASLVVFATGTALLFPLSPLTRIRVGQAYFLLLLTFTVLGLAACLVFAVIVPRRVTALCNVSNSKCKAESIAKYRAFAVMAVLTGAVLFTLAFTHYARLSFVHLVATERYYLDDAQASSLALHGPVRRLARFLPRYGRLWRRIKAGLAAAASPPLRCLAICLGGCAGAFEAVTGGIIDMFNLSEDAGVWCCVMFLCAWFWIALIVCILGSQFGCAMLELLLNLIQSL